MKVSAVDFDILLHSFVNDSTATDGFTPINRGNIIFGPGAFRQPLSPVVRAALIVILFRNFICP